MFKRLYVCIRYLTPSCLLLCGAIPFAAAQAGHCPYHEASEKQVFWGDLHVHSGYSLDAWGYGTAANPAQAYAFAKGGPLNLPDGTTVGLKRPLDFMAVTDHAEWFNLLYICTDPQWSESSYCNTMTQKNSPPTGGEVFGEYVLPTITKAKPVPTSLCKSDQQGCRQAMDYQWGRIQEQANQGEYALYIYLICRLRVVGYPRLQSQPS